MRRKISLKIHSIAFHFIWVLMIGLLVPMAVGMIAAMGQEKARLQKELDQFHRESLANLRKNIEDTLVSFSPEEVKNTAGILLKDERIVAIEVYSDIFDLHLLRVSKQTTLHPFNTISLTQTVSRDNEVLGHVRIEVNRDWIRPMIQEHFFHNIILFATMFAGGLVLILPAIYHKILKPLNRLMRQAETLSKGRLDAACQWEGKDEFSQLGRTLDDMRRRLRQNFMLMEELAVTDDLTGLPNRRGFSMEVDTLLFLCTRYGHDFSLAMLDLDHFKSINDTYGHGTGDEVLKAFSMTIRERIRKSDLFARIGGEEFVLVMPETDLQTAENHLNALRKLVCSRDYSHGDTLTMSVGVTAGSGSQTLDQLMGLADKALYQAKNQGRNRVVALSPALKE